MGSQSSTPAINRPVRVEVLARGTGENAELARNQFVYSSLCNITDPNVPLDVCDSPFDCVLHEAVASFGFATDSVHTVFPLVDGYRCAIGSPFNDIPAVEDGKIFEKYIECGRANETFVIRGQGAIGIREDPWNLFRRMIYVISQPSSASAKEPSKPKRIPMFEVFLSKSDAMAVYRERYSELLKSQ